MIDGMTLKELISKAYDRLHGSFGLWQGIYLGRGAYVAYDPEEDELIFFLRSAEEGLDSVKIVGVGMLSWKQAKMVFRFFKQCHAIRTQGDIVFLENALQKARWALCSDSRAVEILSGMPATPTEREMIRAAQQRIPFDAKKEDVLRRILFVRPL